MILKVNGTVLDFDQDVDVDKQIKLFESIDSASGDFSYSFEIPTTSKNMTALGFPYPDNRSKKVYQGFSAQLLSDDGDQIHNGSLRVEIVNDYLTCSFFSGNSNWFGLLAAPLSDIDFSDLDMRNTMANIQGAWSNTSGVVFPLVDVGVLITRSYNQLNIEDFVSGVYVKTVFEKIFQKHSIKIQGELIDDPLYNNLITLKNGKSQDEISADSSYVQKTTTTARPVENVQYKITFQNDTIFPYYDGSNDAFDLPNSRWIAPARMMIHIEATFKPSIVDSSYNNRIYIWINGVFTFVDVGLSEGGLYNQPTAGDQDAFILDRKILVEEGDIVELYGEWQQSGGSTQNDILSGSVKITPLFIYATFGNALVPSWTQGEFVSNILSIFNVLPSYNSFTKTLTLNLFEKLKSKQPIDLSEHLTVNETDYSEFISSYGKQNKFKFQDPGLDDVRLYNIQNFFKYSEGSIAVDNNFIQDSVDVVESDFSAPQSYINSIFDMSIDRLNLIEFDEDKSLDTTGVTDSSGVARFAIDEDIFLPGDMVRISDSNQPKYNGDWKVNTVGVGYVEFFGLNYESDATGKLTKLVYKYSGNDDVYLMVNIPLYTVNNFSGNQNFNIDGSNYSQVGTAYFNLLMTGRKINHDYKQSLSFGPINNPFFYQRTLIEIYWSLFTRVVNDPVKLRSTGYLPVVIYDQVDFLSPVMIKKLETVNLYYVNLLRGYKGSYLPCDVELIKLP